MDISSRKRKGNKAVATARRSDRCAARGGHRHELFFRICPDLADIASSRNGTLNSHLQWAHQPVLKNQSLPGTVITNTAGTALALVDRVALTVGYGLDALNAAVTVRYFSPFITAPIPP